MKSINPFACRRFGNIEMSFNDIQICKKHNIKLHSTCPNCNCHMDVFYPSSRVGYCRHCNSWLGSSKNYILPSEWDNWAFDNIGKLLADIPLSIENKEMQFHHNVRKIMLYTGTSYRRLSDEIKVPTDTINRWRNGSKPNLSAVLVFGNMFGISLDNLLFNKIKKEDINITSNSKKPNLPRFRIDWSGLKTALTNALLSDEQISIREFSKAYGVRPEYIKYYFPDEFFMLKKKFMMQQENHFVEREKQIKGTIMYLSQNGIFPNRGRVARELGIYFYYKGRDNEVWKETMRELGYSDKENS